MGIKITDEEYIIRANEIHNFKYKYISLINIKNRKYFKILCSTHGEFIQRTDIHLNKGICPLCTKNGKLTLNHFIKESNRVHFYKYNYSKTIYTNNRTKVLITCPEHGDFKQMPQSHLLGFGCTKCTNNYKVQSKEEFIDKFSKIHNDKYDYSLVKYGQNNNEKVKIICPIHGIFESTPRNHLYSGCPKCYIPGYTLEKWINTCNNSKNSTLYIVECYNELEKFIKIGLTSKSINIRFNSTNIPYNHHIIKEIKTPPDVAWKEEKRLHVLYKAFRYKPLKSFDGQFECFTTDIVPFIKNSTDLYPPTLY